MDQRFPKMKGKFVSQVVCFLVCAQKEKKDCNADIILKIHKFSKFKGKMSIIFMMVIE